MSRPKPTSTKRRTRTQKYVELGEFVSSREDVRAAIRGIFEVLEGIEARLKAIETSPHFDEFRAAQSRDDGMKRGNPGMLMWPT